MLLFLCVKIPLKIYQGFCWVPGGPHTFLHLFKYFLNDIVFSDYSWEKKNSTQSPPKAILAGIFYLTDSAPIDFNEVQVLHLHFF